MGANGERGYEIWQKLNRNFNNAVKVPVSCCTTPGDLASRATCQSNPNSRITTWQDVKNCNVDQHEFIIALYFRVAMTR